MRRLVVCFLFLLTACSMGGTPTPTLDTPIIYAVPPPLSCHMKGALPDPVCTPGAVNSAVTQRTIKQTICVRGWTDMVRPKVNVTAPIKRERFSAYGITVPLADAELDHLVPLTLGGAPREIANLWPQLFAPKPGAHEKDAVEVYLNRQVCDGRLSLVAAQEMIAADWTMVYRGMQTRGLSPESTPQPPDPDDDA